MRKTKLTRERHVELGDELKRIQDALTNLQCELGNAAPKASSVCTSVSQAGRSLATLRSDLENLMMAENTPQVDDVRVYFGPRVAKIEPAAYN